MSKQKSKSPSVEIKQTPTTIPADLPQSSWLHWALLGLILITTYVVYRPATTHNFVDWDDNVYVESQKLVLDKDYDALLSTPISLNYHPITMLSLAAQAPGKGVKPKAGRIIHVNIFFHILNTCLVFIWIWMLTRRKAPFVALFVASIFALHPTHVESVAWVSERKDVLYTFFFLAAAITYWQYKMTSAMKWLIACFVLFILSILSKAMAVVFPMVMLLMDYWAGDDMKSPKTYLHHAAFFATSLFFGLMAVDVQSGGDFHGILTLPTEKTKAAVAAFSTFSVWTRLQFASMGFVDYIVHFFAPLKISAFYPYPPGYKVPKLSGIIYPLLTIGLFIAAWWSTRKSKVGVFGLGFYLFTVALVLQFLSVGLALMADRYTYLPYVGIAFMIAYGSYEWLQTRENPLFRNVAIGLGALFILGLTIKTYDQVGVWKNSETLWTQVLQYHPTEDLALANRGNYRGKNGNIEGALQDLEKAVADGCNRADVYEGLGSGYGSMSTKNPSQAAELIARAKSMYAKAIELEPTNPNIYYNLAVAQLSSDPAAAISPLRKCLELAPYKKAEVIPMMGMAQINSGQFAPALGTLNEGISQGIESAEMYYLRGVAYMGLERNADAIPDLQKALTLNPQHPDAGVKLKALSGL
jgi:protein O-mannosyl-transferase